jgi:RNA ligase (TIGR02306 family)
MRKLVTVRKIKDISPIEGADRIEVATIDGWKVVVKKDEFKANDLCIYFEIDSLIPRATWNDFLADKNNPDKPVRLKTITLRGQISQGLALPLNVIEKDLKQKQMVKNNIPSGAIVEYKEPNVGDDLTEILGVEKYEPPVPASLGGDVKGKIPYTVTDEERIQNIPNIIEELKGKEVYITQKIDGTSTTFGIKDGNFIVAGRNWMFKNEIQNTYSEMAKKYNVEEKLRKLTELTGEEWAIQGETYGEGIQKNKLGIKGHNFAIFNVIKNGLKQNWFSFEDIHPFRSVFGDMEFVRILYFGEFKWNNVDELLDYADTFKYPNGNQGEGIVIRPVKSFYSESLNSNTPSFKVISNKFLKQNKDS